MPDLEKMIRSNGSITSQNGGGSRVRSNKCRVCSKPATKNCNRCNDSYCSKKCQVKDWPQHRLYCFPMPTLSNENNNDEEDCSSDTSDNNDTNDIMMRRLVDIQRRVINIEQKFELLLTMQNYQNQQIMQQQQQQQNQQYAGRNNRNYYDRHNNSRNSNGSVKSTSSCNNNISKQNQNKYDVVDSGTMNLSRNIKQTGERNADCTEQMKKIDKLDLKKEIQDVPKQTLLATSKQETGAISKQTMLIDIEKSMQVSETKKQIPTPSSAPNEMICNGAFAVVPLPKSGSRVIITSYAEPNRFYVRPLENENEYNKVLATIVKAGKTAEKLQVIPECKDAVIAEFEGIEFRAVVSAPPDGENVQVTFIDYGNVETRNYKDLKKLPDNCRELPNYCFRIYLKDVSEHLVRPIKEVEDFVNDYVNNEKECELIYEPSLNDAIFGYTIHDVSLKDSTTKEFLNKQLLEIIKKSDIITRKALKKKLLECANDTQILVVDNSALKQGYISCMYGSKMTDLLEFHNTIQKIVASDNKPYKPKVGELVLAKYEDNVWYRAECIEIINYETYEVEFIDFGNIFEVKCDSIRKITNDILNLPLYTNKCYIADLPENISNKAVEKLQEMITNDENIIVAKIEQKKVNKEDVNVIHLPFIINELKKTNLI